MSEKAKGGDRNLRRVDSLSSRFYIGVDLGTTNSSVAYVDRLSEEGPTAIKVFNIPQVVSPGVVGEPDLLPSFFYYPAGFEIPAGSIKLPWKEDAEFVVGTFAREQGAIVPGRMVSSAKSWLCNARVDRQKKILPWNKENTMATFSPVEISSYYIAHIKEAWNHKMSGGDPDFAFENQEVILTVPASFDEVARELTLKAAKDAGLKNVTLLEEPQAAFYYWIYRNKVDWNKKLDDGDVILICDVGGGTTDFSLIVASKSDDEYLELKRIAVGDHILLGGDNMDMAIANHIEQNQIKGKPGPYSRALDPLTWASLCMKSRSLKESLLGTSKTEDSISIMGRGKSVVGSTMKFTLTRDEVSKIFLEGFLNDVDFDNIDKKVRSHIGLRESGLPYADDPSISNHLAKFLKRHIKDVTGSGNEKFVHPDKILFNGGVFKSDVIRNRVFDLVGRWVGSGAAPKKTGYGLTALENSDLDLAVSLGAAYYAYSRSGSGIRIKSGSARSYYIGISEGYDAAASTATAKAEKAVCLVTRGMEDGKKVTLNEGFQVITNQPVQFALFSSTVNPGNVGEFITIDEENYIKLPPLYTALSYGKKSKSPRIDVTLSAYLSEVGTIDLYCISKVSEHRWKLQFNFRKHELETSGGPQSFDADGEPVGESAASSAGGGGSEGAGREVDPKASAAASHGAPSDNESAVLGEEALLAAEKAIEDAFSKKSPELLTPVNKTLEKIIGARKEDWPPSALRRLFASIMKVAGTREFSALHEERWFNLAGFLLRPGFGAAMDDWRVKEALRVTMNGINFKSSKASWINWFVFLRRIAGGMTAGQQTDIFNRIKDRIFPDKKSDDKPFKISPNNQEQVEHVRLFASLELIPEHDKVIFGNLLKKSIHRDGPTPVSVWALSRVGARKLVYGGQDYVISAEHVERWVDGLLAFDWAKESYIPHAAIMMARVTGDRKLDLAPEVMTKIQKRIETCPMAEHLYDLLMNLATLSDEDQRLVFGDSLPHGIVLKVDDK